jgi:hypothetical protein
MEDWKIALFIFGAVTIAMVGQGWMSLLEHNRRKQAMEVIKAALQAGREAPPVVYEQLRANRSKPPWAEVVVFTALGFGFWIAFSQADGDQRTAYLVVAATMTVTALGCLGLAIMRPGDPKDSDEPE